MKKNIKMSTRRYLMQIFIVYSCNRLKVEITKMFTQGNRKLNVIHPFNEYTIK